jgi:hypothetical protein
MPAATGAGGKHAFKIVDFQVYAHGEHNQHQQRRDPRPNGGKVDGV